MKNLRRSIIFLFLLSSLAACKKTEEIIIDDNMAPPDPTVSDVIKENYVNKLYISVLGRKPLSAEYDVGLAILQKDNLSMANREELLDIVLSGDEYYDQTYTLARVELLNNVDTTEITQNIYIFKFLLTDSTYAPYFDLLQFEIDRLEKLKSVPQDLVSGTADIIELHKRCINNMIYDEINMGTENFVVSLFQHFFFRYPTMTELAEATKIVDGLGGAVLLQTGQSKDDFISIFFGSTDYYEGQVRALFQRYLFKDPGTEEAASLATAYKKTKDFKALQKAILSRDDYVGL